MKTRMLLVGFATAALAAITMAQFDGPAPLAWRWVQPTTIAPGGTPLVDGEVVFVAVGQRVYALDKDTGNQKWKFPAVEPIPGYFRTSPIKVGDTIIAAGDNKTVYAIDEATGEKKWEYISPVPILGQPVALGSNKIGLALSDNSVLAINVSDGAPAWSGPQKLFDPIIGHIAGNPNFVFVLTQANQMLALNASDGKVNWHTEFTSLGPDSQPVVYGDTVYVNSTSFLVAVNSAAGASKWSKDAGDMITYPPAASADGIAVVTRDGKIVVFDTNGRKVTHQEPIVGSKLTATVDTVDLGSFALTSPAAVGHYFIFPTTAGTITMFDPHTGRLVWNYTIKPLGKPQPASSANPGGGKPGFGGQGNPPGRGGSFGGAGGTGTTAAPAPTSVGAAGPPILAGSTLLVLARDGSLLAFDKVSGVDLTPPDVTMTYPRPGDQVTSVDLEIHFQLDDESSGLKVDSVGVDVDGKKLDYKLTRDGELIVRFTLSGKNGTMVDGRHVFSVTSSDWLGNSDTRTFSLTIDNNLPKLGPPPKKNGLGGPGGPGAPGGPGGGGVGGG
jgi:outer membrane protein assembly factor BamB